MTLPSFDVMLMPALPALLEEVRDNTGFELLVGPEVATTAPPRADELAALRALDPERAYTA